MAAGNAVRNEMDQVWRPNVPPFLDCVCMCMELIEGCGELYLVSNEGCAAPVHIHMSALRSADSSAEKAHI